MESVPQRQVTGWLDESKLAKASSEAPLAPNPAREMAGLVAWTRNRLSRANPQPSPLEARELQRAIQRLGARR
eukprot:2780285-Rhodomonas_salina.2